jgi:hypothetical protein
LVIIKKNSFFIIKGLFSPFFFTIIVKINLNLLNAEMSWSSEDYIEELLIVAYQKGKGGLLMDVASKIQMDKKIDRTRSFELAAKELNIEIPD